MAFDYGPLATIASNLVTEFGRPVVLMKFDTTPADPLKPHEGPADPRGSGATTVTINAVFVEPLAADKLGISSSNSDLVQRSEQIMIIGPGTSLTEDLATFDEVIDGGQTWKIVATEKLQPATVVLAYFVGVAR